LLVQGECGDANEGRLEPTVIPEPVWDTVAIY